MFTFHQLNWRCRRDPLCGQTTSKGYVLQQFRPICPKQQVTVWKYCGMVRMWLGLGGFDLNMFYLQKKRNKDNNRTYIFCQVLSRSQLIIDNSVYFVLTCMQSIVIIGDLGPWSCVSCYTCDVSWTLLTLFACWIHRAWRDRVKKKIKCQNLQCMDQTENVLLYSRPFLSFFLFLFRCCFVCFCQHFLCLSCTKKKIQQLSNTIFTQYITAH